MRSPILIDPAVDRQRIAASVYDGSATDRNSAGRNCNVVSVWKLAQQLLNRYGIHTLDDGPRLGHAESDRVIASLFAQQAGVSASGRLALALDEQEEPA